MRRSPRRRRRPIAAARLWLRRVGQRLPWYTPADSLEGRNIRNLYAETTWFGILSGLTATFVSVYALRLGATTGQVGWLAALPALVNVVWLVPAARLIERQAKRMPLILWTGLLQRLGYLFMAMVPFVLVSGRVEALIALNTLVMLPAGVINTALTAVLPELTGPDKRGQVVSVRWLILAVTATIAALAGGQFLDLVPVPLNYQLLLGAGALLSMLSLTYLRRMRVPDRVQPRRSPAAQPPTRGEEPARAWARLGWAARTRLARWVQPLAGVLGRRDFFRFSVASFVFYWGLYVPAALWSVLRVRDLGASDAWIGLIAVVIDGSTILGYFYWGKVRERRGDRWVLIVTAALVSVYALLTAVVPSIGWMLLTSVVGGLSWSGCNLALFNVMLGVCPADRRASYVALYTALVNVTAFAGPLLGAALADAMGIRWVFVAAGGLRFAGTLLFVLLMR